MCVAAHLLNEASELRARNPLLLVLVSAPTPWATTAPAYNSKAHWCPYVAMLNPERPFPRAAGIIGLDGLQQA